MFALLVCLALLNAKLDHTVSICILQTLLSCCPFMALFVYDLFNVCSYTCNPLSTLYYYMYFYLFSDLRYAHISPSLYFFQP
ncbi:uncharacterized protein V2V93DRAFT_130056 [Kockiozyma suomiensis]|uniref:uncharacterized protein n=1 Tax=Kockiozyma suomiensis TaxID=1337062 RepID=UPI00334354A4